MTRDHMEPPGGGRILRPGIDCPQCGEQLVVKNGVRSCPCGHKERAR